MRTIAGYDGSLKFDTKIDTTGFTRDANTLKKALTSFQQSLKSTGNCVNRAFSDNAQIGALQNQISSTDAKIRKLVGEMKQLETTKIPTSEYKEVQNQIDATEKKLNALMEKQDRFLETGGKADSKAYKNMQYEADQLKNTLIYAKGEKEELVNSGKAFISGKDTDTYREKEERVQELNGKLDSQVQKLEEMVQKENEAAAQSERLRQIGANARVSREDIVKLNQELIILKARQKELEQAGVGMGFEEYDRNAQRIAAVNTELNHYRRSLAGVEPAQRNTARGAGNLGKSFKATQKKAAPLSKSILKLSNMFKLMLIRMAMRTVISGVKEGFQNLARYSKETNADLSELKSSLTLLKNSFATAFAPVLSVVTPMLSKLIAMISTALSYLGQFFAALSGKSTFVKAKKNQEDYADSLKKTGKEADKTKGKLASFDKLEVISGKESGGGDTGGTDPNDLFEEVPINSKLLDFVTGLKDAFSSLLPRLKELKKLFVQGFFEGLGDYKPRLEEIKRDFQSIADTLVEIFTEPKVTASFHRMLDSLALNLGRTAGAMTSIGITIAQNLVGGAEKYLSQNTARIKEFLITMFDITGDIAEIKGRFHGACAFIFEAFGSENGQQLTANLTGIFADAFMGAVELAGRAGRDILDALLSPITENKDALRMSLEDLLGSAADFTGTIKDTIDDTFDKMLEVYDQHIAPLFDNLKENFTNIGGTLSEAYNNYINPFLEDITSGIDELMTCIQPAIDAFLELVGSIVDGIDLVWNQWLYPLFNWLIGPVIAGILDFLKGLWDPIVLVGSIVASVVELTLKGLKRLIDFIVGVFSGDWKKSFESIQSFMEDIRNFFAEVCEAIFSYFEKMGFDIKTPINAVLGFFEKLANGIIGAVNTIIDCLNGLSFDIPDWVLGIGGNSIGFSLKHVPNVKIPRLAKGAVIPPDSEFLAVLGDQKRGMNIETPLTTMVEAFKQAQKEMGTFGASSNINITLELDGQPVFKKMIELNNQFKKRTGKGAFQC